MRAAVIGAGSFGTAIAGVLANNAPEVSLWGRDPTLVDQINSKRENTAYLPGISLSGNIKATVDLSEALHSADIVVTAAPSHAMRELLGKMTPSLPGQVPIVTLTKGIENETLLTMTEVMEEVLPEPFHPYLCVLSGPSFAKELALKMPTVVTIAAFWDKVAVRCQKLFQTEYFRTYTSTDVIGVQYGGALKNVIAIAAGISDGLGFGHNARAAIITRGLAEISRISVRKGGNPLTLSGLSGVGDLVLTCTGELSRNRRVGLELGKGRKLDDVLREMKQVAEGVRTAKSARDLSEKTGVDLPICKQIYCIAYEGKNPRQAVTELMTRQPKAELV
jgi:glycerol-3-phosphate dehydrogenase (NAD(P)+)